MPSLLLELADRNALLARPDEHAINSQPGRIAEGFELRCCFFDIMEIR